MWRLKGSEVLQGVAYINAVPILVNINEKEDAVDFNITSSLGDRDTSYLQTLHLGKVSSTTATGKKKIISFQQIIKDADWLKTTEVFSKDDTGKLQSSDKERFTISTDETILYFRREYDVADDTLKTEGFIAEATYEKITPEQLAQETATGKGVNFTNGLTWKQIIAKAKRENKYIFVDCYATWCGPCKVMDKYVYPLNIVGDAMNKDFIAVKVQMDSTAKDPDYIKLQYSLARKLEKEYNITGLPTYLFFSPAGKPLHKSAGQQKAKDFIQLLDIAKDPQKQLYTLFEKAKDKKIDFSEFPLVVNRLKNEFHEEQMAFKIARIYFDSYLNKLNENELLTKSNFDFIGEYKDVVKSSDKFFKYFLNNSSVVDSIEGIKGSGWAYFFAKDIIRKEKVTPLLDEAQKTNSEPQWTKMEEKLTMQYGKKIGVVSVLDARVAWYWEKKNWESFFQYCGIHLQQYDPKKLAPLYLNDCAWNAFEFINNSTILEEAVGWAGLAIENASNDKELLPILIDTKSCLLYKLERREDAISLMKNVVELSTGPSREYFSKRLDKMINGQNIMVD
ncbi:MAG: thioredoxin family protein [Chitinophagaceae bacterium]|nr:thioredoxin family protein [Chitinophagaceae bacterium]